MMKGIPKEQKGLLASVVNLPDRVPGRPGQGAFFRGIRDWRVRRPDAKRSPSSTCPI